MAVKDDYLIDTLMNMGELDAAQVEAARAVAEPAGAGVVDTMVVQKTLNPDLLVSARGMQYGCEVADLREVMPKDEPMKALPRHIARRYQVIPLSYENGTLTVAIEDPGDIDTTDALDRLLDVVSIEYKVSSESQIKATIERFYGSTDEAVERLVTELSQTQVDIGEAGAAVGESGVATTGDEQEAPLVKMVNMIIADGFRMDMSDVHIEPFENRLRIRYRIDGVLREHQSVPLRLCGPIVSRLKIESGMSIAEKRTPQDGRYKQIIDDREIDFRVSCLPTLYGESIVMRALDKGGLNLGLDQLGFMREDQEVFERNAQMPDGVMLVTGPTGSGKTTTLYSCLNLLNTPNKKIITVEDPVEYILSGINQVQVNNAAGMTFAAALRAMLRQAPNIIMVGEIRDSETGNIAVNASLTGHFVFSTLHTNDAPGAVTRMVDMGVKPFLVAAATRAILAQRLVRKFCPKCVAPHVLHKDEIHALQLTEDEMKDSRPMMGVGCKLCDGGGYKGRMGLFEVLEVEDQLRRMIIEERPVGDIRDYAVEHGHMKTLRQDGVRKVTSGTTSVAEVMRVTASDEH
ncbi:MAG: GspE/PulE family protein [Verrucomicrobiota bacterium]|jgi:general secretion pathway protein E/type IV pilus assembly protein PilB|nr:GspE/PulE family protein [Verrucomicrobiota bacterium]